MYKRFAGIVCRSVLLSPRRNFAICGSLVCTTVGKALLERLELSENLHTIDFSDAAFPIIIWTIYQQVQCERNVRCIPNKEQKKNVYACMYVIVESTRRRIPCPCTECAIRPSYFRICRNGIIHNSNEEAIYEVYPDFISHTEGLVVNRGHFMDVANIHQNESII